MQILFQHHFQNPIWRLIPSISSENTWVVETRNGQHKEVAHYFIDSRFQISKLNTKLDWWSGVETVIGSKIVFHGYLQEDLPIHQGIKVFDAIQNQWLWENEFVAFDSVSSNFICAKSTLGSIAQNIYLDLETGNEIIYTNSSNETSNSEQAIFLSSEDTYFNEITNFIKKYTPLLPTNFCEYLETAGYIIVSYYVSNEKKLDNYLLVTTTNGDEELHLCISEGLKGVAAGTFLVSKGLLSFVKDKQELFIVEMR